MICFKGFQSYGLHNFLIECTLVNLRLQVGVGASKVDQAKEAPGCRTTCGMCGRHSGIMHGVRAGRLGKGSTRGQAWPWPGSADP